MSISFEDDPEWGKASDKPKKPKNPAAVALGKLGGAKGGPARAEKLTAARRQEIAQKAGRARWAKAVGVLQITPKMSELLETLGVYDWYGVKGMSAMLVSAAQCRELLALIPKNGHTGLALRRRVSAVLEGLCP